MTALKDQQVLVLGGSSGIGLATAQAAVAQGALVTIASRSVARLQTALAALPEGVRSASLDLRDDAAVEAFFGDGRVWDHLVVSGAETPMGPVRGLSLQDAYAAMDSKFWGTYRAARVAQIADNGSITLVSGFLSARPRSGVGVQCAINAAVEGLGRALALELAPARVNTVSPGLIATPLWDGMSADDREAMYARAASRLPAGRVGTPEDVACLILAIATNHFATGSTIYLDGGALVAA
jgi:NAD(P)-dependent dehydrogenase (short-subunit alcohol dehydrogenase family)